MIRNFFTALIAGLILALLAISGLSFLMTLLATAITVAATIWLLRHFNRRPW